ncbi:metalloprotease PmbA [Chromobacterium violaceum]|uniref:metalloprotease PmbA n=1 Tax=Chromobacterium violaceum TaxID=536 RepID=UPI0002F182B3|nr:metalloprotease PmbA [Chromobacterium violaceum]ATP29531.1 metalloprotease PmbA [Chromobacterium violaceum]ATP33436.1 metalloprotease PmbA [Chromobacterium violaceum]KMN47602.1 peptidase PmbA [Chromobacterium violaceum]KMN85802.1 peptidase PmbA [Chromobacterium violaceum]KMN91148.1 peptidase PmbA [Chromobacterium violaceum]
MADKTFSFSSDTLGGIAGRVLELASQQGASSAEVDVSEGVGQTVSVRLSEVETIEYNQDKGVSVTVYLGKKKGHASTSDFSDEALSDTVRAALDIARYTAEDDCAGLADPQLLADDLPDLDLFHPWQLPVEEAIELARRCEDAARAVDARIRNSEGASVSVQANQFVYANSNGFSGGFAGSRHSLSAAVVAEQDGVMQRDYWYSAARHQDDLASVEEIGRIAGERAVRRLGGRRVKTGQYPVLFEAPVAMSLLGHLAAAISGGNLYRKSSFLLDALGKPVMASRVTIDEDPFLLRGLASSAFDNEGVATKARRLVDGGVLQGYFLSSYSARKLGMQTTGNAGGAHNLVVHSTGESFAEVLSRMGSGLLVTELLGQGVNTVTGDYSRGAAGFWVENGVIAYPVEEITIAGNLRDMFVNIEAIADDTLDRGGRRIGSVLVGGMMVAGEE